MSDYVVRRRCLIFQHGVLFFFPPAKAEATVNFILPFPSLPSPLPAPCRPCLRSPGCAHFFCGSIDFAMVMLRLRCGTIRCGRNETIRYNAIRYTVERYDQMRYNAMRYDTMRYDTMRYDTKSSSELEACVEKGAKALLAKIGEALDRAQKR